MSPALAGRFSTTAPPGKPLWVFVVVVVGVFLVSLLFVCLFVIAGFVGVSSCSQAA